MLLYLGQTAPEGLSKINPCSRVDRWGSRGGKGTYWQLETP